MESQPSASNLSIVTTADGSKTIWNEQVGEHYHSRNGALQESRHVFVDAGLKQFLARTGSTQVSILEVGFGTGLNFLLTADYCKTNNIDLKYTGIEAYPLPQKMLAATGYENYVSHDIWSNFWDKCQDVLVRPTKLHQNLALYVAAVPLQEFENEDIFDVIYFDAFAVAHQPEMWNEEAISHTVKFLKPGGIFVTYAITGNLKRMLKGLGFTIEKIPGAAGKREMLRATKIFS